MSAVRMKLLRRAGAILVGIVVALAAVHYFLVVKPLQVMLAKDWNPYGDRGERLSPNQYLMSAYEINLEYIASGGDEVRVTRKICEIELAWGLRPNKDRALVIARKICKNDIENP